MHALGIALLSLGAVGLVILAAQIAWQEARSLRYVSRLDRWAEDVPE